MNKIKVGDVVTYVHRACSLRTSKISFIEIVNLQNKLQKVKTHDLDAQNQDGEVYFEDGCSCYFNQIVSVTRVDGSGDSAGAFQAFAIAVL